MFIYSKISWYVGNVTSNAPVISGYYDSSSRWNQIKAFYLDRWEIPKLIRYFRENPEFGIFIDFVSGSDDLIVTRANKAQRIEGQKLQLADHKQMVIWPLSFSDTHFDVQANEDERQFTHVDIEDAVLYGIEVGKLAGQKGTDLIDGLEPRDCAILYASDQQGS